MNARSIIGGLSLCCGLAVAQQGDKQGEEQPPLPVHWEIPAAPVLSPEDEEKSFQLADDSLVIELFASEPMVQDPVAMEFDADGRLWVVEMRGYMQDLDGRGERDPIGRISILEDTNRDGRADRATVFLDGLILPRAIHVCHDGALVVFEEKLWFAKDSDGDGVADVRELVDADYITSGNPEHQPNGLLRGLDNWIYSAKSDQRYRRVDGVWLKEKTEFRGQWGITKDDFGRLYYNINYSQLHADLFPPNYSLRNTNFVSVHAINQPVTTNQLIFTLRPNTGVNRAYRPGILDEHGRLREFTSACAPLVLRDARLWLGEKDGSGFSVFVCEPAANLVKRNLVRWDGPAPVGKPAYADREFLASTDERFRPVWLATSPDGSLFVADMYRGINQHRQYMTSHLRGEIESRELDKGIHLGRIWRVRARDVEPGRIPRLSSATAVDWITALDSPNGTVRDAAQQLIVERGDASLIPELITIAGGDGLLAAIHALWAIEGLLARSGGPGEPVHHRRLEPEQWRALLRTVSSPNPERDAVTVRVLGVLARGDAERERQLVETLAAADLGASPETRVQVALTVGDLGCDGGNRLLLRILERFAGEALVRDAVFSSAAGREGVLLNGLLTAWPDDQNGRDAALQTVASMITRSRDASALAGLLEVAAEQNDPVAWRRSPLLTGVLENRQMLRRNPPQLGAEPAGLVALARSEEPLIRAAAESIASCVEWPGHAVERLTRPPLRPLTGVFAQQFADGRAIFQQACTPCHGVSGEGLPNLAPPLVDSEWVTGPVDRLVRILLHGLEGPIEVNGQTYKPPTILPNMPAVSTLNDVEIANVIGYITREMGQVNNPVSAQEVTVIRNQHSARQTPWTVEELLERVRH